MKHMLTVLVENKPGVLARVSNLFRRRGFNIDSLAVGPTERPELSRMTIVIETTEDRPLEQVAKQLHKLVNVVKISELEPEKAVARELVLVKVSAAQETRAQIVEIADIFRGKIIDVSKDTLTIEVTGTADKVDAFIDLLRPYGTKELARTGRVALVRGKAEG